jgi:diaminopimelate epimerase
MKLKFTKMHGLGNDFVVIDCRARPLKQAGKLAGKLCDRRFGIGADQLLLLQNSKKADFRMLIFNADGSEVEMCGNGIRCLAKYIWDNRLIKKRSASGLLEIETKAGIIRPERAGKLVKVDMGEPVLAPDQIPFLPPFNSPLSKGGHRGVTNSEFIINNPLRVKNKMFRITCVSMGNPHAIIKVKNVDSVPLSEVGPLIANNRLFPERTNVEFIQILNRNNVKVRVWERGAGETLACGTGASAVGVAANLLGLTGRKITVHLPGGKLLIHWSAKDNHVYMTGPAETVFEGTIEI